MAAITNAEAIKFVNEVIRPLCEEARNLRITKLDVLRTIWFGGMNVHFAIPIDTVEDGREAEGVSRLTAADVTNAVAQLIKVAGGELNAWDAGILQEPSVRLLP